MSTPTMKSYLSLQQAYDIMNKSLFDNKLPHCLITYRLKNKCNGYYWNEAIESRQPDQQAISEIALNIATFTGRKDIDILSTLLHEMVHHWQSCFGEPPRKSYHNKEWAEKMKSVGLYPSSTAALGGKETGQKVSHYVIVGGLFDNLYRTLQEQGITIDWQSISPAKKETKPSSKVKYTCPGCEANAWGKPDLHIVCGECEVQLIAESK